MRQNFSIVTLGLALAACTIYLGYFAQRADFQAFITVYGVFFGIYCWAVFFPPKAWTVLQRKYLIFIGILLRVGLMFSIPNLSDDYARFLWDGHLTMAGLHPFLYTPDYLFEHQLIPPNMPEVLYQSMNSPEYYTVYPPVCQFVFAAAAWVSPGSVLGGVVVLKLFLLLCEIGTLFYLGKLQDDSQAKNEKNAPFSAQKALIYALNPLAILEISGNAHFEGAMIFFWVASLVALQNGQKVRGAFFWACAIASKLLPLLAIPIVWQRLGWKKGSVFIGALGLFLLILFTPLWTALPNILESLDLYFRQFQFNASFYYLVRAIGFAHKGWDIGEFSGPILGSITVLGVLVISGLTAQDGRQNRPITALSVALLWALFLHLSLSATVQPWYIVVPFALSLATKWRFPILWTGLAALSYSHYTGGGFQENYGVIALEYLLLWGWIAWEIRRFFVRKSPQ